MTKINKGNNWMEWFRFITPILITITLFMISDIKATTHEMDSKIFRHLTNDDMHTPKSIIVTKAEFSIYQEMRQRQMDDLRVGLNARMDAVKSSVDKVIMLLGENDAKRR